MVIDPAVFHGDPLFELGMMRLFGGFPSACESAYLERLAEIEGPDVSGAVSKATEEVAEGVQSFFRTAADEDARRQKLIDGMYANSAAPIILDEYDGGPDGVGVEEIAVGEEVARDVLRPVDSAYLVGRDALVGEVDSSALLDRDEAAGRAPSSCRLCTSPTASAARGARRSRAPRSG